MENEIQKPDNPFMKKILLFACLAIITAMVAYNIDLGKRPLGYYLLIIVTLPIFVVIFLQRKKPLLIGITVGIILFIINFLTFGAMGLGLIIWPLYKYVQFIEKCQGESCMEVVAVLGSLHLYIYSILITLILASIKNYFKINNIIISIVAIVLVFLIILFVSWSAAMGLF